jgi:hypothetical protein
MFDDLHNKKYLIFLDIEFQTFEIKKTIIYHILELGVIIFKRNTNKPILIDHVNFPLLNLPNLRLLTGEHSNVSPETKSKMNVIYDNFTIRPNIKDLILKEDLIKFIPDKKIVDLLHEIINTKNTELLNTNKDIILKNMDKAKFHYFYDNLPSKYHKLFIQQILLYIKDTQVKHRLVNPEKYLNKLNTFFKNGTVIHKENIDLIAFQNTFNYYDIKSYIKYTFDIAIYNKSFIKLGISSKLFNTYEYIMNKIKKNNNMSLFHSKLYEDIMTKIDKFNPHNPLVDAFMSIFVYLVMHQKSKI